MLAAPGARAGPLPGADGVEVRLGFGGVVKIGVPVPLDVLLPPLPQTGPAALVVDAPALGREAGRVVTATSVPFPAVAGAPQTVHASVAISDPRRPLVVRVLIDGREALRRVVPISPEQVAGRVLVALSDDQAGLASLRRLPGRVAAVSGTGSMLPRVWQEYLAVDLVVIRDLDVTLDPSQQEALRTWVLLGGRLLIIARPGVRIPAALEPLLPATWGEPRTVPSLAGLAPSDGNALPPGPATITALMPHPGARLVTVGGLPVMASGEAGMGRVIVWGIDPWLPPFLVWSGRLRWWDDALGGEGPPRIDPATLAEKLVIETPLDPLVHVEVGGAILLYVGLLLGLLRWRPTPAGAGWSLLLVLVGVGAFALLAEATRARSATLTEATILEPIDGMRIARSTTIAAVAVPYGGRYRITVPRGMVAQPITPASDLRIELSRAGTVLTGFLRSGEPPRPFQAVGVVPVLASASISADGRQLVVDLGEARAYRAELRHHDRVFPLGALPSGRSVVDLHPDGWVAASADTRTLPEFSARLRNGIFQGPAGDAILGGTTPVLVAELDRAAPVFALGGAGAPGQRLTILLVPLARR